MTSTKDNKLKIIAYSLLTTVLIISIYYYYSFLQQRSQELDQATQATIDKSFAGKKLETQVLKDKKFKDLKKVVIDEALLREESLIITTDTSSEIAILEDIANVPRRHSDPFKPF